MRRIKLLYPFSYPLFKGGYPSIVSAICLFWWCSMLVSGGIYFARRIEKGSVNMYFTSRVLDGGTSS